MRILPKVKLLVLSIMIIAATNIAINFPFPSASPAYAQQASFSNPISIDNGAGDQDDSHVAAPSSGNNVYASYTSEVFGLSNTLFGRSTDGGATFSNPISIFNDQSFFLFLSAIAANGNNVYVAWTGVTSSASAIYLAKSTDGGGTFGNPVQVEHGGNARSPEVAVSGNNVYHYMQ